MKKFILNKYSIFIYGIIFFLLIWWLISLLIDKDSMIMPNPINTFKETINVLSDGYTYKCILYSLGRLILGFLISFILAFIVASIVNDNNKIYHFLSPTMTVLKSVPTAAVVFLFIVISGSSFAPVLVVIVICFPILYEAIVSGLTNVDKAVIESSKIDGSNKIKELFKIRYPLAFPYILLGIITSFSLSFKIEVMAEVITGSTSNGLGCLIKSAQINNPTDMTSVFAYSLIAVVLMLLVSLLALSLKKRLKINEEETTENHSKIQQMQHKN